MIKDSKDMTKDKLHELYGAMIGRISMKYYMQLNNNDKKPDLLEAIRNDGDITLGVLGIQLGIKHALKEKIELKDFVARAKKDYSEFMRVLNVLVEEKLKELP
jgi:hypothetical protein